MTREQVVEYLTGYRGNVARAECLEVQLVQLERSVRDAMQDVTFDILNSSPDRMPEITTGEHAGELVWLPHGNTVGNPTESLAIRLSEERERIKRQYLSSSQAIIKELEDYRTKVMFVDAWLKCLNERQRFVVEEKTIKGRFIREVIVDFHSKFGESYSKSGIKGIERAAIDCILCAAF